MQTGWFPARSTAPQTRFVLLFIGPDAAEGSWNSLIDDEVEYCKRKAAKKSSKALEQLLKRDVVALARSMDFASTTWRDLIAFNETHAAALEGRMQQVEKKLLRGFNESLSEKYHLQGTA